MAEDDRKPTTRIKSLPENLERIYVGVAWVLSLIVQPLAWLLDLCSVDKERRAARAAWLRKNYLWILLPVGIAFYLLFFLFVGLELAAAADAILARFSSGAKLGPEDIRNLAYGVAALLGALAVAATVPFQLIKTWVNERQTDAAEQGLVTDRFTKAVGQLGEEKTVKHRATRTVGFKRPTGEDENGAPTFSEEEIQQVWGQPEATPEDALEIRYGDWETIEETVPNLEVRLGAIYALERIAQDSERDHIPIMEVLCAYVRENARGHVVTLKKPYERPRADVKAVLDVLGRRFKRHPEREAHEEREGYRLDLTYTDLAHRDLYGLTLPRANLSNANLEGAWLLRANLEGAKLGGAKLQRANLKHAHLEEADLWEANLEGADLRRAKLEGAYLELAHLEGADLRNANLRFADLRDWSIARANLRSADLSTANNLPQESVDTAFGDRTTKLPDGIEMPEDWETRAPLMNPFGPGNPFDPDPDTDPDPAPDPDYDAWLAAQRAKAGKPAGDPA